jgi:Flp pilus assembly protein TadG
MSVRRLLRNDDGATAVEFAMLAPLFFAMAFGVIDAGRLVWTQMSLEHAVEAAARCASLQSASCSSASLVQTYAASQAPGLGLPSSAFTYSSATCGAQVSATYIYYYLSSAFPGHSTLTAQYCMPVAPT